MRSELAKREGKRGPFTATFERTGFHRSRFGVKVTMLFLDVRDGAGVVCTDHVWFIQGKQARVLRLKPGERVGFNATVAPYYKRDPEFEYGEDSWDGPAKVKDYRLLYPSHLRRLGEPLTGLESMPLFSGEQTL